MMHSYSGSGNSRSGHIIKQYIRTMETDPEKILVFTDDLFEISRQIRINIFAKEIMSISCRHVNPSFLRYPAEAGLPLLLLL